MQRKSVNSCAPQSRQTVRRYSVKDRVAEIRKEVMRRKVPQKCGVIPLNGCAPQTPSKKRRKVPTMRRKVPKKSGVIPFKLFCGIRLNGYAPQSPSKERRYSVKGVWRNFRKMLNAAKSVQKAPQNPTTVRRKIQQQSAVKSTNSAA